MSSLSHEWEGRAKARARPIPVMNLSSVHQLDVKVQSVVAGEEK